MSLKRSHTSTKSAFGGGDAGAKVDRQELYDELKRMAAGNETFTPVDVALAIGAGEPQVSKALLGLAAEGYLEKVESRQVQGGRDGRAGPGRVPEGVRARVARRFDPAARPLRDRAPETEQRHDEAAAAHRDRRARSLPGGAEEARDRSRARARSRRPPPPAPAGAAVPAPPTAPAPGPAGSGGSFARFGRCAFGPWRHRRPRRAGRRRAPHADPGRREASRPCASR